MMTLREIAESKARANRATPGPWTAEAVLNTRETEVCAPSTTESGNPNMIGHFVDDTEDDIQAQRDTLFVAAARTDVPALCETARRAIELLQRWHDHDVSSEDYEQMIADFLAQVTKEP